MADWQLIASVIAAIFSVIAFIISFMAYRKAEAGKAIDDYSGDLFGGKVNVDLNKAASAMGGVGGKKEPFYYYAACPPGQTYSLTEAKCK